MQTQENLIISLFWLLIVYYYLCTSLGNTIRLPGNSFSSDVQICAKIRNQEKQRTSTSHFPVKPRPIPYLHYREKPPI